MQLESRLTALEAQLLSQRHTLASANSEAIAVDTEQLDGIYEALAPRLLAELERDRVRLAARAYAFERVATYVRLHDLDEAQAQALSEWLPQIKDEIVVLEALYAADGQKPHPQSAQHDAWLDAWRALLARWVPVLADLRSSLNASARDRNAREMIFSLATPTLKPSELLKE